MTNAQIVFQTSISLMESGIIGTTGNILTVDNGDGTTTQFPEPEAIHTYNGWKALGYQVRKGSKAVAQFPIWKYKAKFSKAEAKNESGETVTIDVDESKMFMKTASWFTLSQVEPIKA